MTEKLLKVASVVAAHGIRGEVRLKVFLEDRDLFADLGPFLTFGGDPVGPVEVRGQSKNQLVARVSGASNRDAAEALRGFNLFIPRARLPSLEHDEFYYTDLVGLEVREQGDRTGRIKALHDHGAGDLVEIAFDDGTAETFTFSAQAFPTVNLDEGFVTLVRPTEVVAQDRDGNAH